MRRLISLAASAAALTLALVSDSHAVDRDWDGGGATSNWSEIANWDPDGDPGGDDLTIAGVLIGAGPDTVLDTDFVVSSLDISNSSEVDSNSFLLAVEGHTQLSDAGTRLQLRERTSGGDGDSLDTDSMAIFSGSIVEMYQGSVLEVDNGELGVSGTLVGNGTLELNDNPASPTELLSILGSVVAGEPGFFIGAPPPRTLNITATDPDARILMFNVGLIDLQENATLNNEVRMDGDFLTNLRLGPNSTYRAEHSWTLTDAITVNSTTFSGSGPATIAGGQSNLLLTLGSLSTVTIDAGESLRFDMEVSGDSGSTVSNSGTVIFDRPAQFDQTADFQMNGPDPHLVVNSDVTILQDSFDIDAGGSGQVTVNPGAVLRLDPVDFGGGDTKADGTININSGQLFTGIVNWTMDGTLNLNNTDGAPAQLIFDDGTIGQQLEIGDGNGASDANLVVEGDGASELGYRVVVFRDDADVDIGSLATLDLPAFSVFDGADATFDGAGTFWPGAMRVNAATTFNIDVVDLEDGVSPGGSVSHILDAHLTVNANQIDLDGDGFEGLIDIVNTDEDSGQLTVNVPSGAWRFESGTITATNTEFIAPTALSGSDIEVGAAAQIVAGEVASTARMDIQGTINIPAASESFRLLGGSTAMPNTLQGGLVTGDGELRIIGSSLSGFGTIDADIRGLIGARLVADNGTLNVNGAIQSFQRIEVADDAVLDVGSVWSTSVAGEVVLSGGELTGEGLIIDSTPDELRGHGLVTSLIANDGMIRAEGGVALVFEPPSGNNNWDGESGDGALIAESANLVLGSASGNPHTFFGSITVEASHEVFVDGFNLRHREDALLQLNGGTYRTTGTTELDATINTGGASSSTIQNDLSSLLDFGENSTITVNQNLHIDADNAVVRAGATFSGVGSVINERQLTLSDGLELAAGLVNHSSLDVGSEDVDSDLGAVELSSLTQSDSGDLSIDLNGLVGGQFDTITVDNNAILEGSLTVNLLGGFTPLAGNSWTVLTTSLGLVDADTLVINAPVVNDLTFVMIVNSDSIVLNAVDAFLFGDYNADGVVDAADYTVWRDNLGSNATLPGDTTPGSVTLADYEVWRSNFGNAAAGLSEAVAAVPEPSTWALLSLLALLCTKRRHAMACRCGREPHSV